MLSLIVTACLALEPKRCIEERVAYAPPGTTPQVCLSLAMPVVAQWAATHTAWKIKSYRCALEMKDGPKTDA